MQLEDYFSFLGPNDIRLKGHRIGIETILYDYINKDMTPEEIAAVYTTLTLEQVYATILQGRPNGMPSFMGKVPDYQIWELAAYVRSMSGLVPSAAAPGRNDDIQGPPPENSIDTSKPPKNTRIPS